MQFEIPSIYAQEIKKSMLRGLQRGRATPLQAQPSKRAEVEG